MVCHLLLLALGWSAVHIPCVCHFNHKYPQRGNCGHLAFVEVLATIIQGVAWILLVLYPDIKWLASFGSELCFGDLYSHNYKSSLKRGTLLHCSDGQISLFWERNGYSVLISLTWSPLKNVSEVTNNSAFNLQCKFFVLFLFYYFGAEISAQGLVHAKHILYHWATSLGPFQKFKYVSLFYRGLLSLVIEFVKYGRWTISSKFWGMAYGSKTSLSLWHCPQCSPPLTDHYAGTKLGY